MLTERKFTRPTWSMSEKSSKGEKMSKEKKEDPAMTWSDIEVMLATEIVENSKKKSRKWFTAWLVTAAALVASNLAWILGGINE